MATIKDENYFVVHGWMRTKLFLKGNELTVYAILYGFSQDGESEYRGTSQYIADFSGAHKDTVRTVLKNLEAKGLVKKVERNLKTGETNGWICVPLDELWGGTENAHPPLGKTPTGDTENTHPPLGKTPTPPNILEDKEIYKEVYKEDYIYKQVSNLKEKEIINSAHARESYDDLLDAFGVRGEYRSAVFRFIGHLKVNFNLVMLNDRLEDLIIKLDRVYDEDIDKATAIDDAIVKGYKRLDCECA